MKLVKRLSVLVAVVALLFSLAACSNVSQKYADKINAAAEKEEYITYGQVKEDLGDEAIFYGVEILNNANGVIIAVKGCTSQEQIDEKLEAGKELKGIYIVILNNKATSAEYRTITKDDTK